METSYGFTVFSIPTTTIQDVSSRPMLTISLEGIQETPLADIYNGLAYGS